MILFFTLYNLEWKFMVYTLLEKHSEISDFLLAWPFDGT